MENTLYDAFLYKTFSLLVTVYSNTDFGNIGDQQNPYDEYDQEWYNCFPDIEQRFFKPERWQEQIHTDRWRQVA